MTVEKMDAIWTAQSQAFHTFWNDKIMAGGEGELDDPEIDTIVRILDRNGKGNTRESEAVPVSCTRPDIPVYGQPIRRFLELLDSCTCKADGEWGFWAGLAPTGQTRGSLVHSRSRGCRGFC